MYLPALSDRELAHHADLESDPLTATEMQVELLKRFTAALDVLEGTEAARDLLEEHDIEDADALREVIEKAAALDERTNGLALLDALREHDIDDPAVLKKLLERDAQLVDVLTTLAEPLASLQALATT